MTPNSSVVNKQRLFVVVHKVSCEHPAAAKQSTASTSRLFAGGRGLQVMDFSSMGLTIFHPADLV